MPFVHFVRKYFRNQEESKILFAEPKSTFLDSGNDWNINNSPGSHPIELILSENWRKHILNDRCGNFGGVGGGFFPGHIVTIYTNFNIIYRLQVDHLKGKGQHWADSIVTIWKLEILIWREILNKTKLTQKTITIFIIIELTMFNLQQIIALLQKLWKCW